MVYIKKIFQKKFSEWWFCKNKCNNISTNCKRIAFILIIICILIFLGLLIYFYCLKEKYNIIPEEIPKTNQTKPEHNQLIIELLIAVDRTMKNFHKENLNSYIFGLTSMASKIFSDASIGGNTILISVTNIIVLDVLRRVVNENAYGSELLDDFCGKVAKSSYHYDAAIFMTRDRICSKECKAIGLARMGSICTRKSCALIQDNGLQTAITIAHELGHILGMPHDNDDRCKNILKPGVNKSIMHTQMTYDMDPWSWSDCSRHYLLELLEHEDGSCLEYTPIQSMVNYSNTRLAGEIYSLDQQCEFAYGSKSHYCHMNTECKRLWCKDSNDKSFNCHSNSFPWADGTPCKNNHHNNSYWCQKGECVPREDHNKNVVDGGWGPWSSWSQCSLSCGGGIQKSLRECNNPLAQNGGKYCAGVSKKYRSCNTQNCPHGSMDAREEQCYQKNGKNLNLTGIGPYTKWLPKYVVSPKDKCDLYCYAQGSLITFHFPGKVVDGTACSLSGFDKCVNGVCRPAGCDNQLNSIARIDKCGICEGNNNTCEDFTETFYVSNLDKVEPIYKLVYYPVTTIPKGATNIIIEQTGFPEENHIVLKDNQGKWLLNGNFIVTPFRDVGFYAGVVYDYNGSRSLVERVNTTYGRVLKKDLIVEILSYSKYNHRDKNAKLMTYSYSYSINKTKINNKRKT